MGTFVNRTAGIVVGTLVVGSALVLGKTTAGATDGVQFINLKVQNDQYAAIDVGAAGVSVGDTYAFSDTLTGDATGEDGGTCEVVRVEGEKITTNCVISLLLPKGTITVQSLWVRGASPLIMAVTGGTGAYRNARGDMVVTDIQTPQEAYRIRLIS